MIWSKASEFGRSLRLIGRLPDVLAENQHMISGAHTMCEDLLLERESGRVEANSAELPMWNSPSMM